MPELDLDFWLGFPGHAILLPTASLWDWHCAVLLWPGNGASTTCGHLAEGRVSIGLDSQVIQ